MCVCKCVQIRLYCIYIQKKHNKINNILTHDNRVIVRTHPPLEICRPVYTLHSSQCQSLPHFVGEIERNFFPPAPVVRGKRHMINWLAHMTAQINMTINNADKCTITLSHCHTLNPSQLHNITSSQHTSALHNNIVMTSLLKN